MEIDSVRDVAVSRVKALLETLPEQVVEIVLDWGRYEYRIEVVPKLPNRCRFSLAISNYGTYGLCFGHGLAFEDVPLDEFPPEEVVAAILHGRVREELWSIFGWVVKVAGRITLFDGRTLEDKAFLSLIGILGVGKKTDLTYSAYPEKTCPARIDS